MDYIYTITSEDEIRDSFFEHLRRYKAIDSAIYYLDEGANLYYKIGSSNTELKDNDKYSQLIRNNVNTLSRIISLGCGNSLREKLVISDLLKNQISNENLEYIGIDTSITMLSLSMDQLKDFPIKKKLICADFSSQKLRNDLSARITEDKINIFTFLGATMGNFGVEYSMDLLSDITKTGDYLLFDIRVRKDTTILEDRKLYEYYRDNYVYGSDNTENIFSALAPFCITKENGEIGLEMVTNEALNSLHAKMTYTVKNPIVAKYHDRHMKLMPGDVLTLKSYIAVDQETLREYLKERDFEFIDFIEENEFGYFLFRKK